MFPEGYRARLEVLALDERGSFVLRADPVPEGWIWGPASGVPDAVSRLRVELEAHLGCAVALGGALGGIAGT